MTSPECGVGALVQESDVVTFHRGDDLDAALGERALKAEVSLRIHAHAGAIVSSARASAMERDEEAVDSLSAAVNSTAISAAGAEGGGDDDAPAPVAENPDRSEPGIVDRVSWSGIRLSLDERFQPKWLNGAELKTLKQEANSKGMRLLESKSFYATDAFKKHCTPPVNIPMLTSFKSALTVTHTAALAEIDKQIQEVKSQLEFDTTPSMDPSVASDPSTSPIHMARAKMDIWSTARTAEENAFTSTIKEVDEFISQVNELQKGLDASVSKIYEKVSEHERKLATSVQYNIELLDEVVDAINTWHNQHAQVSSSRLGLVADGGTSEYVTHGGGWLSGEQVVHHPQHCIGCDASDLTPGTFVERAQDAVRELRLEDSDERTDATQPAVMKVRGQPFKCKCKAFQIWYKSDPNELVHAAVRGIATALTAVQHEKGDAEAATHNVQQPQTVQGELQGILATLRALYT